MTNNTMHPQARVSFHLTGIEDAGLEAYDNTKLVAYNTCPAWGVLRYQMHKAMPNSGRAMALEAGSACHEVFSYVRLMTLAHQLGGLDSEGGTAALAFHGPRLFGVDRWDLITSMAPPNEDILGSTRVGSLHVLESSGFYDDPRDRRRTLNNLEECVLAYVDRWRWDQRVWMRDVDDPQGDVGIEIPFDLVVTIEAPDAATRRFRYTGKIDGIHVDNAGKVILHENKTASRLNDAWSMSFALSSQVTGYCLAASVFTESEVREADVIGLSIPLPKDYNLGGFVREHVTRQDFHFKRWVDWALHTVNGYETYHNDPHNAPRYTHSCSRYFRPCSFVAFCDADDDEQRQILTEMVTDEWSPLHAVGDTE